jgi:hypothetical protein
MSGLRLELALLDCEHSLSEDDLLELIYRGSPARSPLLKLLQLFKYLMLLPVLPNIGSCGLLVRVLPAGTQPIKVSFTRLVQLVLLVKFRVTTGAVEV